MNEKISTKDLADIAIVLLIMIILFGAAWGVSMTAYDSVGPLKSLVVVTAAGFIAIIAMIYRIGSTQESASS